MKPFDLLFLVLSVALTGGSAWAVLAPSNTPLSLEIQTDEGLFSYPLGTDQDIAAKGPLGNTQVHVEGGHVHIGDSPCTNKVCQAMGVIDAPGEWVACLPNRVFVRITGGVSGEGVDAGVY